MNQTTSSNQIDTGNEDILFECPKCGKSLEIDARGAGYIIICPDCKNEIQVPAWNSSGDDPATEADTEETRHRIQIEEMLRQLQAKVTRIEKQQVMDDHCFKRIGDEIALIQATLDRITEITESRHTPG